MLLDWMLPGMRGVDFAKKLKRDRLTRDIPVIIITAKGAEEDKVRGLESGADDYITKPFSTRELIARIRAVIRRVLPHIRSGSSRDQWPNARSNNPSGKH